MPALNNRYILHEALGQGAMGVVYRATDRLTSETVAVKQVTVARENLVFASRSDAESADEIKLALAREFQTLASLRHPNIISVLDYGFDSLHQPFFTMTYLPEAQDIIKAGESLDETGRVNLLVQVLQALTYLHRRGILHRDLKPANLLVTQSGVRVLDFGLSVSREQARGRSGTLAYMAPETLQKGLAFEASDLYAVGVIAYQMFSGELPFQANDILGILTRSPDSSKILASPKLVSVILRLLEKSPSHRYTSAFEAMQAFTTAANCPPPAEDPAIRESFLQAARFVGRDTELEQLLNAFEQAANRHGSLWLIGGESGVGKSRLLRELRIRALVRGARVLQGQAVAGHGQPYQIWQEPLRHRALLGEMSDLEARVLKPILPDLENLLDRKIPDAPELEAQDAARRLALIIAEAIRRGAEMAPPLVLILEDLHWELERLDTLAALGRVVSESPILVVATYRSEEVPDLPERLPDAQSLLLHRFDPASIAELSASMLGESGIRPQVLNLLQEETEGNVFFLVETVRALAEEAGGLQSVGGATLPQSVFAGGVRRIILRRLERVPVSDRPPLKLSAVIGRALEPEVLQTAYPELALEPWLAACANVAVLEAQGKQWRFAHDKLREVLLDELAPDEQRELHRQAAAAIEATFRGNLAPHYGKLAWHHARAGNREQERRYARLAGEHAAARYAYEDALQFFHQALAQTPEDDSAARCKLLLAQEAIYKVQGKPKARLEILQTLQPLAKMLNNPALTAQVHLRWVTYYHDRGDFSIAIEIARQALKIADAAGCSDISVKLYNWLASALWKQNQLEEARSVAETGLESARQTGNKRVEANLMGVLGMVAFSERDLESARQAFERSLAIATEGHEEQSRASALSNLGMVAGYQGDFQAAQRYYEQAMQIAETIGAKEASGVYLANLGWVLGLLGEYEQAIRCIQENIRVAREIGDSYSEAYGLVNLSSCTCAIGDVHAAQDAARQAREVAAQIGDRSAEAWALTSLGHSLLAAGDLEQASAAYRQGLEIREQLNHPLLAAEPAAGLAAIFLEQGDLDGASRCIRMILPVMEQKPGLDGTDDPLRVYLACYRVLAAQNDPAAADVLKTAFELIQSRAAKIPREQNRRAFLENIPHHREILRLWEQQQISDGN